MKHTALCALLLVVACKKEVTHGPDASEKVNAEVERLVDVVLDAGFPKHDAEAPEQPAVVDGGLQHCRVLYGPEEQPFRGPASMRVTPTTLELWLNDRGVPRIHKVPIVPPSSLGLGAQRPQALRGDGFATSFPGCAVTESYVYCMGTQGKVFRTPIKGGSSRQVAAAKPGSRIVAASLPGGRSVLGFVDERHTKEGMVQEAWVALDETAPVRLSEDGSGATWIELGSHVMGATAFVVDGRAAMTPMHARSLGVSAKGELTLGPDAVVAVGGPADRGMAATFAIGGQETYALVTQSLDALRFGMSAFPISEPVRDNVVPIVSEYPNGVEPAALAATTSGEPIYVVRLRPQTAAVGASKVLELGRLSKRGVFESLDVWGPRQSVMDLGIVRDSFGTVWITHGDARAVWLERRMCPNVK